MKNSLASLFNSTAELPYVGEKTFAALCRLNCNRNIDLLFHLPYDLEVWDFHDDISKAAHKSQISVNLEIQEIEQSFTRSRKKITKMLGFDGKNYVYLTYFNYVPYINRIVIGNSYIVSGKLERLGGGEYQIIHPEILDTKKQPRSIEPKYPLTYAITSKQIHSFIKLCLAMVPKMPEWLSEEILLKYRWLNFIESLTALHHPKSQTDLSSESANRKRIAFDELLASQLALRLIRINKESFTKGNSVRIEHLLVDKILAKLGFTLTDGQKQVLTEIESDQTQNTRMMRLLQGDVGSGKTLVSLCAMLNVVENGKQAALMVPTDILANQHFQWISNVLEGFSINVQLLTGNTKKSDRTKILEELSQGKVQILVGTHALFQKNVEFSSLQLVVIDEQHRFGVEQRLTLMDKGKNCDVLVMSATPIPRTLALTTYGDMDISILAGKPKGRMPIQTSTVSMKRIEEVVDSIKRKLENNEQVFWVCPLIEHVVVEGEDELKPDLTAVTDRYNYICSHIDSTLVGLIHGKLSVADKDQAMADFATGKTKILIATTVIEVGIDVPQATLLVVENAERFGLAQLHQLRGRVGRGSLKSDCILLYGNKVTEIAKTRLQTMRNSNDGFYIAEQDLRLRGGGDVLGLKQSGMPEFRVADLEFHQDLLLEAHRYADHILNIDPKLSSEQYKHMRILLSLFDYDQHLSFLFAG